MTLASTDHLSIHRVLPDTVSDDDHCIVCHTSGAEMKGESDQLFVVDKTSNQAAHLECLRLWYTSGDYAKCELCQNPLSDRDFELLDRKFYKGLHKGDTAELINDLVSELELVTKKLNDSVAELRANQRKFGYGFLWYKPHLERQIKQLEKTQKSLTATIERATKLKNQSSQELLSSHSNSLAISALSLIALIGVFTIESVFSVKDSPQDSALREVVSVGFLGSVLGLATGIYYAYDALSEVFTRWAYS